MKAIDRHINVITAAGRMKLARRIGIAELRYFLLKEIEEVFERTVVLS